MAVVQGYNLREVAESLGLGTTHAARLRVNLLRDVLSQYGALRRGPNNELLVTAEGLRLLQRLEELHRQGMTLPDARANLLAELGAQAAAEITFAPLQTKVLHMEARLKLLERRVDELEERLNRSPFSWLRRLLGAPALKPPKETRDRES